MAIDDMIPDVSEGKERFEQADVEPTKVPAVYAIYHAQTGEALYVGETKNLHQRITDHHHGYNETDLRKRIENDPELDIPTKQGELWEYTELKWIRVDGGRLERKRIERAIENRETPRYSSR